MPTPKVDSAVIRLNVRREPPVKADKKAFFAVVKAAFGQRRKVISNSLSAGLGVGKEEIRALLRDADGLERMAKAMRALSVPNALDRIVDAVLEYAGKNRS
jgi:16S rRNA (adenine1518-N6/adenine1519-N6)-dimethyltransferase